MKGNVMVRIETERDVDNWIGTKRVWLAVLVQHIMDAKSVSKKASKQRERTEARDWLFHSKHDFELVCEMAGYDAVYVRECLEKTKNQNFAWREGDFEKYIDYVGECLENQTQFNLFGEV